MVTRKKIMGGGVRGPIGSGRVQCVQVCFVLSHSAFLRSRARNAAARRHLHMDLHTQLPGV